MCKCVCVCLMWLDYMALTRTVSVPCRWHVSHGKRMEAGVPRVEDPLYRGLEKSVRQLPQQLREKTENVRGSLMAASFSAIADNVNCIVWWLGRGGGKTNIVGTENKYCYVHSQMLPQRQVSPNGVIFTRGNDWARLHCVHVICRIVLFVGGVGGGGYRVGGGRFNSAFF